MSVTGPKPHIPREEWPILAKRYISGDATIAELAAEYGVSSETIRWDVSRVEPDAAAKRRRRTQEQLAARVWAELTDTTEHLREIADRITVPYQSITSLSYRTDLLDGIQDRLAENRRNRTHKTCSVCGETKPIESFHLGGSSADGHSATCKPCARRRANDWTATHEFNRTVDSKDCPACGRHLPANRFRKARSNKSGLQTYCAECANRQKAGATVAEIAESWGRNYRRTRQRFEASA